MSEFNDKYIPVTLPLPEYMTPFDDGYSPPDYQEQLEAAAVTRDVVEEKILELMHGLTFASKNAGVYSGLTLDSFNFQGEPIEIEIRSADTTIHPDLPLYEISVFDGSRRINGDFMQVHNYSIPNMHRSDEGVTRRDVDLPEPPNPDTLRLAPSEVPGSISPAAIEAIMKILQSGDEIQQLDRQMGVNSLPIDLSEARAIALFISRGELKMSLPNYSKTTG